MTLFRELNLDYLGGQKMTQTELQISVFTERQKEVFQLILNNPRVMIEELSRLLNINESAVQKPQKTLVERQFIERLGTKGGYWRILKK